MSDSVRPHPRQPTRLPCPWDFPGKDTGVGCHFLLQCMKVKSESEVTQSCPTLATPWTAAYQAPLSMGFSRARVLEWSSAELFFWKTKHSKANFGITSVGSGSIIVTFREWRGSGGFLAPTRKGDDHRGAGGWQLTPADWHKEQSDSGASFGKWTLF